MLLLISTSFSIWMCLNGFTFIWFVVVFNQDKRFKFRKNGRRSILTRQNRICTQPLLQHFSITFFCHNVSQYKKFFPQTSFPSLKHIFSSLKWTLRYVFFVLCFCWWHQLEATLWFLAKTRSCSANEDPPKNQNQINTT